MKRVAEELGLDAQEAMLGLDLEAIAATDEVASEDYKVVKGAVSFALDPLPRFGSLEELCSFDKAIFADGGKVSGWSATLSSNAELAVERKAMARLETARQVACGSLRAWSQHSNGTESADPEADYKLRNEKRETIRLNTINALLQSGPRETRAGGKDETIESEKKGKTLANLLQNSGKRRALIPTEGEMGAV
jgi:hypothetical protein